MCTGTRFTFLGCPFQEENKFYSVILGRIRNRDKFWGVVLEENLLRILDLI